MNKIIIILIIVIIIIGGIWYINKTDSPLDTPATGKESVDNSTNNTKENIVVKGVKTFDINGKNFSFSQTEVRVKKGDRVRINFKSTDGFHDWVINKFRARTSRVQTGGTTSVEFIAKDKGTFEYYCSVGSHRQLGMVGKLIVE